MPSERLLTPNERKNANLVNAGRGEKYHNRIVPKEMIKTFIKTGNAKYLKGFGSPSTMLAFNIGNKITENVLNSVKNNKNKWITLYLIKDLRNRWRKFYWENGGMPRNKRLNEFNNVKRNIYNIANSTINKNPNYGRWGYATMKYNKIRNK